MALVVKNLPANSADGRLRLIPESGRSSAEGHSNPLQYSCLENPHGQRNLVGYIVNGVTRVGQDCSDLAHMLLDSLYIFFEMGIRFFFPGGYPLTQLNLLNNSCFPPLTSGAPFITY